MMQRAKKHKRNRVKTMIEKNLSHNVKQPKPKPVNTIDRSSVPVQNNLGDRLLPCQSAMEKRGKEGFIFLYCIHAC